MIKINQLSLIILLLISWVANAGDVRLLVEGLSGALEKNVRAQLSAIENDEVIPDRQFRARIDNAIRKGLKALGYYDPAIDFGLCPPTARGEPQTLIVRISPGNPVLISNTRVVLSGSGCTDQDYLDLLITCPKIGTVLNHSDYDQFKKNITNVALRKGYFDGQFTKSQLGISMEQRQAFWDIHYDSGERYSFGDVTFKGSQISDEYLQNLIPFKKNDYYQFSDLNELNHRLSATGWFKSVVISPEFDKARKTKVLPLFGVVSPNTQNTIETGIGYSTDAGLHVKAIWKKPWINSYGHSLTSNSSISELEQKMNFSYKIPLLKNPLKQYYTLQGNFKHTDLNDTEQDSTVFILSRYWDLSNGWQRVINLRWSLDRFTQSDVTNTTMLFYPSVMISRTRSRGGLMPMWGDSQRYSIYYSNLTWGSDVNFFVVHIQNVWIRTLYNRHRLVIRGNLGWLTTKYLEQVPPDLRFFAGGDYSIRGYKYKSISPENEKGQLTGASELATGSLEYQYNTNGKWWGAIFFDGGGAMNDIKKSNYKTGAGIGVRWQSPIGTIKFDFALPIKNRNEHDLQFYIGLGPEL